jgi:hypothetical protein
MGLLTTHTHHWELCFITARLLANLYNLKIITAPAKYFPSCCVFNSLSLVTASISGDSLASHAHAITCQANILRSQRQSQSHVATDGQSVSKSWFRAPSGAHDQIFITV